jgi:hypothetical protein
MLAAARTLSLWLLPFALAGCALNQLRIEEASDVAAKGKVSVAAARDYLGKVATAREATNLEFVGLDPACRPNVSYLRMAPQFKSGDDIKKLPPGWLCDRAFDEGKNVKFSLAPPGRELLPALTMLDGLGTYFAAITDIVAEPGPTTAADFQETIALFHSAGSLAGALGGEDGALGIPAPDDAKVKAVVSLIGLIDQMVGEQQKVKALRALVAKDDSAGTLMADMRKRLHFWDVARGADARMRTRNAALLMNTALDATPAPASDARQQLVRNYYARAAGEIDDAKLFPVLDGTLKALIDADADMRRALAEHPDLNAKQRARLAQLTRKRITAAFDALTGVLTAFAKGLP